MVRLYLPVIVAAVFLLVIFLTKITLRLSYRKQGKDDYFALGLSLWRGLIHYKLEIPVIKKQPYEKKQDKKRPTPWVLQRLRPAYKIKAEIEGKEGRPLKEEEKKFSLPAPAQMLDNLRRAVFMLKKYYTVILYLFGHTKLRRFNWQTEIGAEDPSQAGILAGMAWGVKGFVLSCVYHMFGAGEERPSVIVTPNFKKACLNTDLDCIFEVRIGYIIITSFKALAIRLK